jgi:hypothetical protein
MVKKKFYGFLIVVWALILSSCLGRDEQLDEWLISNAQIAAFSLSHDSIIGLGDVKFTIDQVNGKIFNRDSMPFGTVIKEKVICSISFEVGSVGVMMVNSATDESFYWDGIDSVDFSSPVLITVYPYDGVSTKTYEAKINIHQVNPDSMAWWLQSTLIPNKTFKDMITLAVGDQYYMYAKESTYTLYQSATSDFSNWESYMLTGFPDQAVLSQLTRFGDYFYVFDQEGTLYESADGKTWTTMENAPVIKALMGVVPVGGNLQPSVLTGIAIEDESFHFVSMNDLQTWTTGKETPENFPITGFGRQTYMSMYHQYLIIASGRDMNDHLSGLTWSTTDGLSWTPLTKDGFSFSKREGSALYHQGDTLYLMGGIDEFGMALRDVYYSRDKGITWLEDTIHVMPETFGSRGFTSVIVDKNNFVLLFGGKAGSNMNVLNEVWCGRINHLGFKDD